MGNDHRLRRLRELLARIEQLPASAETERMLSEVRARIVDVDTGETTRAMLPVDPLPTPATDSGAPTARAPKAVAPKRKVVATRAETGAHSGARTRTGGLSAAEDREWLALVATNDVLSLDDSTSLAPPGDDRRPWRRGLRG